MTQPAELPYQVETYDAFDAPDDRSHLKVGNYGSAEEALARAMQVVDDFLIAHKGEFTTAGGLSGQFEAFGEVPMIFGPSVVEFSPYDYAQSRAREMYR